ncbi:hypothetical protein A7K92_26995 [Klebsiella pneumoniae]|nr:hypothetical protein A7K92_26995 [Klebsiella pneumoniae]
MWCSGEWAPPWEWYWRRFVLTVTPELLRGFDEYSTAGIAGVFFASYQGFVNPTSFHLFLSRR